jgi:uncharacterized membrane protein
MMLATWQAVLYMGIFFILLGILSVLWSRREQIRYYDSISKRRDVKEFLTREPEHLWLGAWRIGGKLSLIVGIVLVIVGIVIKRTLL